MNLSDETSRELGVSEMERLSTAFAEAALRALEVGFDAVELHGAHGFLLNQFISPLTNRRSDDFGGSLENRMRFPLRVVMEVKRALEECVPVFFRLGASDLTEGDTTVEDGQRAAWMLAQAGVNCIDVSGGMCGSMPPNLSGQGYFIPLAHEVKKAVSIPVTGVGGIVDPMYADEVIIEGPVDLVAVGRAILRDPNWGAEAVRVLGGKDS